MHLNRLHAKSCFRFLAPIVGLTLVLTACTSGEAPDERDRSADAAPASPTPEPAPSQEPCDLLTLPMITALVPKKMRKAATLTSGLDSYSGRMKQCSVKVNGVTLLSFGYSSDPELWRMIKRNTRPHKHEKTGDAGLDSGGLVTERVRESVAIGDEAFVYKAFLQYMGFVRVDDVALIAIPGASAGGKGISGPDLGRVMYRLMSAATGGIEHDPITLPPACPGAGSPEVTAFVGTVSHAHGHPGGAGQALRCEYTGETGLQLSAGGEFLSKSWFESQYPESVDEGDVVIEDSPQRWVRTGPGFDPGEVSLFARYPRKHAYLGVSTDSRTWGKTPRLRGTQDKLLAFWDVYRDAAEASLQ